MIPKRLTMPSCPCGRFTWGSFTSFGKDIFSWASPVGRLWYTQSMDDGYTAPRGIHSRLRVDLKRYIRIRSRELEGVTDIFRRQLAGTL